MLVAACVAGLIAIDASAMFTRMVQASKIGLKQRMYSTNKNIISNETMYNNLAEMDVNKNKIEELHGNLHEIELRKMDIMYKSFKNFNKNSDVVARELKDLSHNFNIVSHTIMLIESTNKDLQDEHKIWLDNWNNQTKNQE